MNNLYIVVSEELSYIEPILDFGSGPEEYYHVIELIIARNHSQARITTAKHNVVDYNGDVHDIPKMYTRILAKNLPYPSKTFVSDWEIFSHFWLHKKVLEILNKRGIKK